MALIGIIQKPLSTGKIYGFWTPSSGPTAYSPVGGPFGPFVNRNHFAGWMLLLLPVCAGFLIGTIAGRPGERLPTMRERLLSWASAESNRIALIGFAVFIMAVSLVATLSRSGIACFVAAITVSGLVTLRTRRTGGGKPAVVGYLFAVAVLALLWVGLDSIISRFQIVDVTLQGRWFVWQDTLRIFDDFVFVGTGFNTYSAAMLFYQTYDIVHVHFAEAHNDYLQLLAEGGLLVTIPVVLLMCVFIVEVYRRFAEANDDVMGYWIRVGAITGVMAIGLQEIVDFSLQMPGNTALFALISAIAVRKATIRRHRAFPADGVTA